ncbi:hypothetical protein C8J56DRAFT_1048857 [Mycena floridula]|nr:hypothetical protein C8J56DRAFT_1048857 [Mycena floridula]
MPAKSKAAKTCAQNLTSGWQRTTIEEVADEEPPGTAIVEDEDDSDYEESDEEEEEEIQDIDALELFATTLQRVHDMAMEAEEKKEEGKKKRKHYMGTSTMTKWRQKLAGEKFIADGFQSVTQFFQKLKKRVSSQEPLGSEPESRSSPAASHDSLTEILQKHARAEESDSCPKRPCVWAEEEEASSDAGSVASVQMKVEEKENLTIPEDPAASEKLRKQQAVEQIEDTSVEKSLNQFNYRDFEKLRRAKAALSVKAKDKKLDVVLHACITAMVGTLNLYLDSELSYIWREASSIVARAQGHSPSHARMIQQWIHQYLSHQKLPLHSYCGSHSSILQDKDISLQIQLRLSECAKDGYIKSLDVVEIVASQEIQKLLEEAGITKRKISECTGREWLRQFKWRYSKRKNGMYIDGHERDNVVAYQRAFVERFEKLYAPRMSTWVEGKDKDGNCIMIEQLPKGGIIMPPGCPFQLILVTHDESTFFCNDQKKIFWQHADHKAVPQPKGEGVSLMVSDYLTSEWGRLQNKDGTDEARIFFKAGKNRDGYFDNDDIVNQTDHAIDIFEERTNSLAVALFLFDNAPSHQKHAPDALSAHKMPKKPNDGQTQVKDGPKMRPAILADGTIQHLYFPDDHAEFPGWFKGMEQIICKRGLWLSGGLNAQCEGFKCEAGKTDCCCCRLLFNQPDFVNQKSCLQELVERRGHICDFYPKYHCELNFIKQYWGAAKYRFRSIRRTTNIAEMEEKTAAVLDDVPLDRIRCYANRAAHFISAYHHGLTGSQAAWAT